LHPDQTAGDLWQLQEKGLACVSISAAKAEVWASGKICSKITVLEGGTRRAAQGWRAAALTITQLGPSEEGRSEVEVTSV